MKISANKRILVTGGAGLIGSALIWRLNQMGCDRILVSDHLNLGEKWKNLVPLRYEDYIAGDDLRAKIAAGEDLGQIDLILHMGACSATTEKDSDYLMRNNYQYSQELCRYALKHGAKFVYASSAATYGDGANGMDDAGELEPLRPLNMYGYSKHLFDKWAQREGILDRIVGLKFFNVFGPNENHKGEMRSVVNKAFHQIRETGRVSLFKSHHPDYEDGKQMRDFLYVKDCVEMTLHLASSPLAGGLYNLGSGKAQTWLDLVEAIFAALDMEPNIDFVEMPEHLRGKYQYFTEANVARLEKTGYTAGTRPLKESVRDYVQNYLVADCFLGDGADE
ncbi:ADP-glyceromanno-heptose 6-epimerase [Sulfuriroseicoccus oceanibius]|uniref:ADP-L-glycero-D-manno-heptose-6-epimerase n=1 Tax=Sulfuriroseicoccus oceanibius TaxID=2707525 RepID=A0A6B3LCG4_9BACT|nr:ADP-glyceromanno-heptose 6-epimerase [Sulfuriroseicoccus oceanibius]QQL45979.1 ADP-glyceromanno-heptose 6-epimerase [Sulfuriroseicoccus oceanibius]